MCTKTYVGPQKHTCAVMFVYPSIITVNSLLTVFNGTTMARLIQMCLFHFLILDDSVLPRFQSSPLEIPH